MTDKPIVRKCIVDGITKPTSELLRFVMIGNTLYPDFNKKLPGKGIYVTNNRISLETALAKKLFNKVTRHNLKIDDDFVNIVENIIKTQALNSLNIARKAGALVAGFEKVKEEIKKNKVEFIIEALDAGKDGKEKIAFLAKSVEIFNLFSIDELDITLNKENTVHIAILKSDTSRMVYNNLKKYENFLSLNGDSNQ
ncbi:MAG: DUF448 domain-containing protein [Alphaproteobacteria bacterium]|nr:DUF448 domain-containing protein [Alphaproteobacteria bacterium]